MDGATALVESVGVRAVDEDCVLALRGDDARTWLNGQVTNDLRALTPERAVYALVLNARGKIVAEVFVVDRGADGLALVTPASAEVELRKHFEKYIIMEDVEVVRDDGLRVLTAQGPRAAEAVAAAGLSGPVVERLGTGGQDALVPAADAPAALARLESAAVALGGRAVTGADWELAAARRGVPRFGTDFGERSYPQEAGLRERAVSFTKGCYLGQEVVCTLESRGQLVRKLVQLSLGPDDLPRAGDPVLNEEGATVGDVTSATADPAAGQALAFAYLKRAAAVEGASVRAGGRPARVRRVLVSGADGT